MIIKICGITSQDDAAAATLAGADALGFNFYEGSPRYLTPEEAAGIVTDAHVLRVGVFVDAPSALVTDIQQRARLDVVQLHGKERAVDYWPHRIWKAVRVRSAVEALADDPEAEMMLLDGPAPGTGAAFDWSSVKRFDKPFLLAGGLHPDNVAAAIRELKPAGVDTCSGVESEPGKKDHRKMQRFVEAARAAARGLSFTTAS